MADRILVVDDDEQMQYMLREALGARGFEAHLAPDAETALEKLGEESYDLVVLDVRLPGISGIDAIPHIARLDPHVPIIMMTAHGTRQLAIQAIGAGAYDFFEKPFQIDELSVVITRALEKRQLAREVHTLSERLDSRLALDNIVGHSGPMRAVFNLVGKVVETDVTVLLRGESGTGKELIAQAIHHNSPRRDQAFVKLNCVAIPETLLESELFGHEKGSFTGAVASKPGKFELANHGTIFLDEIGDMTLATQAKILRVLQERECERVGGSQTIKIDVRIIAATNKDLAKAVEEGSFREDLYYRLNVFAINLPPLRQRKDDIPPLIDHFVATTARQLGKQVSGFSGEAMDLLLAYDWPGNVRELENYVQRAVVMTEEPVMDTSCLPAHVLTFEPRLDEEPELEPGRSLDDTLEDAERKLIRAALRRTGGVQTRAAKLLGITERSLWHRIKKLAIDVETIKDQLVEA
ncbi:MAG: sigma-54-dependent transcriptional regulator [Candidatus Brocadiia bacterium]